MEVGERPCTEAETSPGDPRRILDALRHIVQVMRTFSVDAEAQVGLTAAQLFALQVVVQHGPLSVNALAGRTLTHQSSVSVVAQRLVEKGLVRRRRSPEDQRQVLLQATAAGSRLASRAPAAVQDRLFASIQSLSPADRIRLTELLEIIVNHLAPSAQPPPMFLEPEHPPRRTRARRPKAR